MFEWDTFVCWFRGCCHGGYTGTETNSNDKKFIEIHVGEKYRCNVYIVYKDRVARSKLVVIWIAMVACVAHMVISPRTGQLNAGLIGRTRYRALSDSWDGTSPHCWSNSWVFHCTADPVPEYYTADPVPGYCTANLISQCYTADLIPEYSTRDPVPEYHSLQWSPQ